MKNRRHLELVNAKHRFEWAMKQPFISSECRIIYADFSPNESNFMGIKYTRFQTVADRIERAISIPKDIKR